MAPCQTGPHKTASTTRMAQTTQTLNDKYFGKVLVCFYF